MKFGNDFPVIHFLYTACKYSNHFDALLVENDMKMNERNQMKSLAVEPPTYDGF